MYFIMKIVPNYSGDFVNNELIYHTTGTISIALKDLEKTVFDFIREEYGKNMAIGCKIIDITTNDMIIEPNTDSLVVYRYRSDPHKFHIYQRKTNIVPALIYGKTWQTEFKKIVIFELLGYDKINNNQLIQNINIRAPLDLVHIKGKNVKVPVKITQAPMTDLIDQLKKFSISDLKKVSRKYPVDTDKQIEQLIPNELDNSIPNELDNSIPNELDNSIPNELDIESDDFFKKAKKILSNGLNNYTLDESNESDESSDSDSDTNEEFETSSNSDF